MQICRQLQINYTMYILNSDSSYVRAETVESV